MLAVAVGIPTANAATITDFVETPNSLSFNFLGNGAGDYVSEFLPALKFWQFNDTHVLVYDDVNGIAVPADIYAIKFDIRHLPDGYVELGGFFESIPFGVPFADTEQSLHSAGLDIASISITVNRELPGEWGVYYGSFSALHTSVPETPVSGALLGSSLLAMGWWQRNARRRDS